MKRNFVICIDMDDTIEDLTTPWVNYLNHVYNLNVSPCEIKSWNVEQYFPTLTKEQVFSPMFDPDFWNAVVPKLNAPYWVKKLIDDGHDVYICTNTHYKTAASKFEKVLFRYFPFISPQKIIITSNKQMIQCDYLIDDGPHNIIGNYTGLLVDMPHNRDFNHPGVTRIFSLEQAYSIISADSQNMKQ